MGFVSDFVSGGPSVNAGQYGGYTNQALQNNLQLQQQLRMQAAGGGPDLAGQMFRNTAEQNSARAASLVGSMKGVSPAAASQMITNAQTQATSQASGQAAMARIQQQLQAQALLNQASLGMSGQGLGYQAGANATNAQIYGANLDIGGRLIGGALNGAGAGMAAGGGAPPMAAGGEVGASSRLAKVIRGIDFKGGGLIPGKAQVSGDSEKNDTVPIRASPGEIVLPRTVAQGDDAPEKAKKFVEHLKRRSGKSGGYKRVIEARKRRGGE